MCTCTYNLIIDPLDPPEQIIPYHPQTALQLLVGGLEGHGVVQDGPLVEFHRSASAEHSDEVCALEMPNVDNAMTNIMICMIKRSKFKYFFT